MHKNALFFLKKTVKLPQRWGPMASGSWELLPQTPELLLPSPVTVIFLKTVVALTSLLSKRNEKNLEISNIFLSSFCLHILFVTFSYLLLINK